MMGTLVRFFFIVVVLASALAQATELPDRCGGALSNRILVVEDDRAVGSLFQRFLTAGGFEAVWVTNGADALAAVKAQGFLGAFVDLHLGTENGGPLARRLHDEFGLPIIMLSGSVYGDAADFEFPSAAKPLGPRQLVELAESFRQN